jgi:hypothetical protein
MFDENSIFSLRFLDESREQKHIRICHVIYHRRHNALDTKFRACPKTRNNRNETTGTTGTKPPEQPERNHRNNRNKNRKRPKPPKPKSNTEFHLIDLPRPYYLRLHSSYAFFIRAYTHVKVEFA